MLEKKMNYGIGGDDMNKVNILCGKYIEYRNKIRLTSDMVKEKFRKIYSEELNFSDIDEIKNTVYYADSFSEFIKKSDFREIANERLIIETFNKSNVMIEVINNKSNIVLKVSSNSGNNVKVIHIPLNDEKKIKPKIYRSIKIAVNYILNGVMSEKLPNKL